MRTAPKRTEDDQKFFYEAQPPQSTTTPEAYALKKPIMPKLPLYQVPQYFKDRSSGGFQLIVHEARLRGNTTTDVSSVNALNSNRDLEQPSAADSLADEKPYVEIRLTKEILLQFDKQTKVCSSSLIAEYLNRCELAPGSITGLISSSSSYCSEDDYYGEEGEE